jgi:hypothetical protein
MPKQKKIDFDWEAVINGNRIGVHQVIESIRKGERRDDELFTGKTKWIKSTDQKLLLRRLCTVVCVQVNTLNQ